MKVKYSLLFTANPFSDSKAAESVFKILRRLDILSRDILIYLPGFHTNEKTEADSPEETKSNIAKLHADNQEKYADFHGKDPIFHAYCDSAGDMYFNDADFTCFMKDFEDQCPKFEYYGRTDLIIIPSSNGDILNDKVDCYNLEPFFDINNTRCSLEEFLMSVFKLLQKDIHKDSLDLLDDIRRLYDSMFRIKPNAKDTDMVIRMDNLILQHMNWKEADEIFFISYSTKDEFNAFALKQLLENHGKHVWIAPDGIPSGLSYACAIPAALRLTSRFVVLLSHSSANSTWVPKEIGKALSNKTRVDGIFLEGFTFDDLKKYDDLDYMFENVQLKYNIVELFEDKKSLNQFLSL